jgi:hypothetical protein
MLMAVGLCSGLFLLGVVFSDETGQCWARFIFVFPFEKLLNMLVSVCLDHNLVTYAKGL